MHEGVWVENVEENLEINCDSMTKARFWVDELQHVNIRDERFAIDSLRLIRIDCNWQFATDYELQLAIDYK